MAARSPQHPETLETAPPRRAWTIALFLAASAATAAEPGPFGASLVTGKLAPPLLQRRTDSIRAYAFHAGKAAPVPFQVDERDPKGRWAVQGPSPVVDDSPGRFDGDDAVVLLNRTLGERGTRDGLPPGAKRWLEVRVGEEKAPIGFVYLASFDAPPPLATEDFCRYDATTDTVFAERYAVRFDRALPVHLGFVHQTGESGENVLAGMRARGEARILAGLIHIERTEKDLDAQLHGWHDGPVRVVRTAKYWIRLPLGFKARGKVNLVFYPDFVEAQARVNIKIPPRLVPADGDLAAWFDFRNFAAARILLPGMAMTEPFDRLSPAARRDLSRGPARWSALLLPGDEQESFLLAVRLGGSLAKLEQHLRLDDASGQPGFGFRLSEVNKLDTGEQDLAVTAALVGSREPAAITTAGSYALAPPEVAVSEMPTRPALTGASRNDAGLTGR